MKQSELSGKMQEWSREFFQIKECKPELPDGLWRFLASRICDAIPEMSHDSEVICVRFGSGERMVRVNGTRGGMLSCSPSDGTPGLFLCKVSDVLPEHRSKLTAILNKLEQEGKI